MASHDALTGLLNHAAAREIIARRMKENPEGQYALIIVDLDFFKAANDQFGHIFGDRVQQYTAQKLLGSIRAGDIGARVGGDEFLIFVEYTSGIENMVERIWHALLGQFEGFAGSVSMALPAKNRAQALFAITTRCFTMPTARCTRPSAKVAGSTVFTTIRCRICCR